MHHPPPEVTARPATADETPRSARALMKKAQERGWDLHTTYARGTDIAKKDQRVVDSIMVQLTKTPLRAVAVFHDGSYELGYAWSPIARVRPARRGYRDIVALLDVA